MAPNWVEIGTLFVTGLGLLGLYIQIKKLTESSWGETHAKLCDQSIEIIKLLAEKPETYDYFYNGKELEDSSPHRVFILYASEAIAVFLEHLALQKQNMPKDQWVTWHRFMCSTYVGSPVLRDFLKEHREWYSDNLMHILEQCPINSQSAPPHQA